MRQFVVGCALVLLAAAGRQAPAQPLVTRFPTSVSVDANGAATIQFRNVTPMTIEEAVAQLPDQVPLGEVQPDGSVRPGIEIRNDTSRVLRTVGKAMPVGVVLQPDGEWTIRSGGAQIDDAAFEPGHAEVVQGSETIALQRTFWPGSEFDFPIHTTIRPKRSDNDAIGLIPEVCDPDVNGDHVVDAGDAACLTGIIAGGEVFSCVNADFNRDGVTDFEDINALMNVIACGDCP